MAEKLVAKAIAGDNWCMGYVTDRLDGKPTEHKEQSGTVDHAIRIVWAGMPAMNDAQLIDRAADAPQIENKEQVAALPAPQSDVVTAAVAESILCDVDHGIRIVWAGMPPLDAPQRLRRRLRMRNQFARTRSQRGRARAGNEPLPGRCQSGSRARADGRGAPAVDGHRW